jgi:hypothetical protein
VRQPRGNPNWIRAQVAQAKIILPDANRRQESLSKLRRSISLEKFEDLHRQNVDREQQ